MLDRISSEIRALEDSLCDAYIRKSAGHLSALLADDFREFGSSGRIFDKAAILRELATQPSFEICLLEFEVKLLNDTTVLATYRAEVRIPGKCGISSSLRSSIWQRHIDGWRVLFHQGTRLPTSPNRTRPA